jgi:hypothetical protein
MEEHHFTIPVKDVKNIRDLLEKINYEFLNYVGETIHEVEVYGIHGEPFKIEVLHPSKNPSDKENYHVLITYFGRLPKE